MLDAWRVDDIAESALELTEAQIPIKSILDRLDDESPTQSDELAGGFRIDENVFNEEDNDET